MCRSASILLSLLLLCACAGVAPPVEGVLFRAGDWPAPLDQGLAVAPLVAAHPISGGAAAASAFTREFFVALEGSSPGTQLLDPERIHAMLDSVGPQAHARLRSIRRQAFRAQAFDAALLAQLGRDIGQRWLLVGWMDEGTAAGLQKTVSDDLTAFEYQMHVHGYSTEELHGQATAVVIDLHETRVVWRGAVRYASGWLDWQDPARAEAELFRTRAAAAAELASLLRTPADH